MEVIGNSQVHFYEPEDEVPQTPGEDSNWQESFVVYFWDVESKVFAFLRLSQQPSREPATFVHWIHIWTPEFVYRHVDETPFGAGEVFADGLVVDGGRCSFRYDGKFHWTVRDAQQDIELNLSLEDAHPPIGPFAKDPSGAFATQSSKEHIEATGPATGLLKIAGVETELRGVQWRDHSWGNRDWYNIRCHRFFPAMFGPEFNFFAVTFVGPEGGKAKVGSLICNDTIRIVDDFDILVNMGSDGVTNAGGKVRLNLDGRVHEMIFTPLTSCGVSYGDNFALSASMCSVTMDGKTGIGVSETSNNLHGGQEAVACISEPTLSGNGLFATRPDPWGWP